MREHEPVEAQRFADRPRLERAAVGRVRRIAVGDLGDMPEAVLVEMTEQRREEAVACLRVDRGAAAAPRTQASTKA